MAMGLLDGKREEKAIQLHIKGDMHFHFRKLPIQEGFLVEKQGDAIKRAWLLNYKLQKRFDGYKGINTGAGLVTVCYDRDIIYDPFNQLKEKEKPIKGLDLKKKFIKDIATSTCYKHEVGKKGLQLVDKMIIFVGATMILEVFGILILIAKR
jgi:hypothetical protein